MGKICRQGNIRQFSAGRKGRAIDNRNITENRNTRQI